MTSSAISLDVASLKKQVFEELIRFGPMEDLRRQFLDLVRQKDLSHTDHIRKQSDWIFYVYFCRLLALAAPDRTARILDWGGLYGQVTKILMLLGYTHVQNYLLEIPPHYDLFQERFGLATCFGNEPNRINVNDESLDILISSGVLEHVEEDGVGREDLILADIKRVLKPGGLFFIWNLPAMLGTSEILAMLARKWRHQKRYWLGDIKASLSKAGFFVLGEDKHKFLPGSLANRLGKWYDPVALTRWDDRLSRLFPFSLFARDLLVLARKP